MASELTNIRNDEYSLGQFMFTAVTESYDYATLDYTKLREIYLGLESTGMQYGGVLAQVIVDTLTAFEYSEVPTVRVIDKKTDKENEDLSKFSNMFLKEQHARQLEGVHSKNLYGDGYLAFNIDRNLEALPPQMVDPGFAVYSQELESATVIQNRIVKSQKGSEKGKARVTRIYTPETIQYQLELIDQVQGYKKPKPLKVINPLGVCPVTHMPNLRKPGFVFGFSDFYTCIPYFMLFHRILTRGFESQQYSGRPVLVVSGIEGPVAAWLQQSFNIDPNVTSDTETTKVLEFFNRHKLLCLSGNVKVEFVESKSPTGKTEEILNIVFSQISRLCGIPEFLFGGVVSSSVAGLREQYARLDALIRYKQQQLNLALDRILRQAWVWYTTFKKNEETGEVLESYGLVSKWEDTKQFAIQFVWPELLGTDARLKIETMAMMAQAKAVSREGLLEAFPQYITSPSNEVARLQTEMKEFMPLETPPLQPAQNNSAARSRKTKGTGNNTDGSPQGTSTKQR